MRIEDFLDWLFLWAMGFLAVVILGMSFVYLPRQMYAEAECLSKGYPKAKVTVGLRIYCISLKGETYAVVDPQ